MKVCLKAPFSNNLYNDEAIQLIFIEFQMTGLHMTKDLTERSCLKDLKIPINVKNY